MHTPVTVFWHQMTLGQVMRYVRILPDLLPLINPLAGMSEDGEKKDTNVLTDPTDIRMFARRWGIKSR